jgi:hypothetical protein
VLTRERFFAENPGIKERPGRLIRLKYDNFAVNTAFRGADGCNLVALHGQDGRGQDRNLRGTVYRADPKGNQDI